MSDILKFFSIDHDLKEFDVEVHRNRSIGIYDEQHKAYTKNSLDDFNFHQKYADPLVIDLLDEMVQRDHADIHEKYLKPMRC
jgi:hypothetical protein